MTLTGSLNDEKAEIALIAPSSDFVKAAISAEYIVSSPEMNYVKLDFSYDTVHYTYQQNCSFEPWASSINVNIQTPWEGYHNMSSSMEYNFKNPEKFINILFDNGKKNLYR